MYIYTERVSVNLKFKVWLLILLDFKGCSNSFERLAVNWEKSMTNAIKKQTIMFYHLLNELAKQLSSQLPAV